MSKRKFGDANFHPSQHTIYCSGPMFNPAEKSEMADIASELEKFGFKTYLPQRDGLMLGNILSSVGGKIKISPEMKMECAYYIENAIFSIDMYMVLVGCDGLVFNVNGRVPDEGAVGEASVGFLSGHPVVTYKNDVRCLMAGADNPIIRGLNDGFDFTVVNDIPKIPAAMETAFHYIKEKNGDYNFAEHAPPTVQRWLTIGKHVWEVRKHLDPKKELEYILGIVEAVKSTGLVDPPMMPIAPPEEPPAPHLAGALTQFTDVMSNFVHAMGLRQ